MEVNKIRTFYLLKIVIFFPQKFLSISKRGFCNIPFSEEEIIMINYNEKIFCKADIYSLSNK
jgi:hypothetical protein